LTQKAILLAEKFWPGPLTLIVEKAPDLPQVLTQGDTVGVRAPDHRFAITLLEHSGPLAVTSANFSGDAAVSEVSDLSLEFRQQVDLIVDAGKTPGGLASTVIDCTREPIQLLRTGPIRLETIMRACQEQNPNS
jgi:L-threonylcarbamoyladenylate synthase